MKKLVILIALMIGVYWWMNRGSDHFNIIMNGDEVVISNRSSIRVTIKDPSLQTQRFVLVGSGQGFDMGVFLPVIPLARAEELAQQYGDFRKCMSPGAGAGKASIQSFQAFSADQGVYQEIINISQLGQGGKDVVFEMTFQKLKFVSEKNTKGIEVLRFGSFPQEILVSSIRLIDRDRDFSKRN